MRFSLRFVLRFVTICCLALFVMFSPFVCRVAATSSAVGVAATTDPSDPMASDEPVTYSLPYGYLQGGYFVECELYEYGYVRVYVPAQYAVDAFALDAEDQLINTTNDTIYGYCSDIQYVDDYTGLVRWSMFGTLEAQREEYEDNRLYYNWYEVGGLSPSMYNIHILSEEPPVVLPDYMWSVIGFAISVFCAVIIIIFRRR